MNNKLKLGAALFSLGFIGILTILTATLPMDSIPKEVLEKISPQTLKMLMLINPTILLLIAVLIGTALHEKVNLSVPNISAALNIKPSNITWAEQLRSGILLGIIAGVLITIVGLVFRSSLPQEFVALGEKMKVTPIARFGYGGFTEEILMRYGFMTLIVWVIYKITKQLKPHTYWLGIIIATFLFAFGHFPVVYNAVKNPSIALLSYVLIGNASAGIFFGWLYWKKGLEAAFIAHIFAHIIMMIGESVFQIQ